MLGPVRAYARRLRRVASGDGAAAGTAQGGTLVRVEFAAEARARWGYGQPAHPRLQAIIDRNRDEYGALLAEILMLSDDIARIPLTAAWESPEPRWHNAYFFGLDAVALYALLALRRPARIIEVGSGNSTKFARRAIADHGLPTRLVSVDPRPRAEIADICDEVIRQPLQDVDLALFSSLQPGDVLFIDGSHYVSMNSDVVVAFLEVMPALPPGVLVHVHDVFLPWDYRPEWADRWYSEQYLLAAALLAGGPHLEVLLPAFYVHNDAELSAVLAPLWERIGLQGYERAGHSFWLRTR